MRIFKSEGIRKRSDLIYELGLDQEFIKITVTPVESPENMLIEVIKFYKKFGFTPRRSNDDNKYKSIIDGFTKTEQQLGKWLSTMKCAYKGNSSTLAKFHPYFLDILNKYEIPNIFEMLDDESIAVNTMNEVIQFIKTNNREPIRNSNSDKVELDLAKWITIMRRHKKTNTKFFPILDDMAENIGYPNLFNPVHGDDKLITKGTELINFVKTHNRYPSPHAKNKEEERIGLWMHRMRKLKREGIIPIVVVTLFKKRIHEHTLFPKIFELVDRKEEYLNKCNEIVQYYLQYGKPPTISSMATNYEKSLAGWICRVRMNKNDIPFFEDMQSIVKSAGMDKLFDPVDNKQNAIDTTNDLVQYVKYHKKYPMGTNTDPIIKRLCGWVSHMRCGKLGKGTMVYYPEIEDIASANGLPNMFNKNWRDDLKNPQKV